MKTQYTTTYNGPIVHKSTSVRAASMTLPSSNRTTQPSRPTCPTAPTPHREAAGAPIP